MMLCRDEDLDLDDDSHVHRCVNTTGHRTDHECECGWTWEDPDERRTR